MRRHGIVRWWLLLLALLWLSLGVQASTTISGYIQQVTTGQPGGMYWVVVKLQNCTQPVIANGSTDQTLAVDGTGFFSGTFAANDVDVTCNGSATSYYTLQYFNGRGQLGSTQNVKLYSGSAFNPATATTCSGNAAPSCYLAGTPSKPVVVPYYQTMQQSGSALAQRGALNFSGAGVACTDDAVNNRTNCAISGTSVTKYAATFTAATTWTILAATSGMAGPDLKVTVYDSGSGSRNVVEPGNVSIDASGNVTISFAVPQAGRVVISQ